MFYRINLQYLPSVRLADSVVIEPPYVHRRRKADEYIVYLIKKGVMYLEENGETVTLQPGDMYVLDPRYIHVGVTASWCEYFYVHFRHPDMEPLEEETEKGLQKLLLENRHLSRVIFSAMKSVKARAFTFRKAIISMITAAW